MKKLMVLWLAAVALTLSMGIGFAAARNSDGMHGHGGPEARQGFEHHGFHRGFEPHQGFVRPHGFGRFHHFDRHSRVIIIGDPFFGRQSTTLLLCTPSNTRQFMLHPA
ncbi:hypothetical protein ACFQAT_21660 [Undibacterium arcticum]|uniref:Uncharacterized protein n=1 Tax=Undibacterium arcticum TaxID=1762892 RepID=A0ABV7F104_9BURK